MSRSEQWELGSQARSDGAPRTAEGRRTQPDNTQLLAPKYCCLLMKVSTFSSCCCCLLLLASAVGSCLLSLLAPTIGSYSWLLLLYWIMPGKHDMFIRDVFPFAFSRRIYQGDFFFFLLIFLGFLDAGIF